MKKFTKSGAEQLEEKEGLELNLSVAVRTKPRRTTSVGYPKMLEPDYDGPFTIPYFQGCVRGVFGLSLSNNILILLH